MTPTIRHALVAALVFCASCATGASIDVASPNPRFAGARLYVEHKAGYSSTQWGGRPDTNTLFFTTNGNPFGAIDTCMGSQGCNADLAHAELAAVIAPDSHAAAISINGGATWRYLALDGVMFLCRHHTAATPAELWTKVPSTRALAAEIFLDPGGHADTSPMESGSLTTKFQSEVFGALAHAEVASDPSLWVDIARGFGTPAATLDFTSQDRDRMTRSIRPHVRALPAMRAVLVAAMASPDAGVRRRVAEVLALSGAEDAEEALAVALDGDDVAIADATHDIMEHHRICWARAAETWALASIASERHAGSPAVLDALRRATHPRFICPSGDDERMQRAIVISAIRGLAALRDDETLRKLAGEAKGSVRYWCKSFEAIDECVGDAADIATWAKSALAHLGE